MKCTRCNSEIPAQSRFCLKCGAPIPHGDTSIRQPQIQRSVPTTTRYPEPTPQSGTGKKWILPTVLGLLLLVGVGVWGLSSRLTQKASTPAPPAPLVQAPAQSNTGTLVQAPAQNNPAPVVQQPAAAGPDTSAITNYLAFLQNIEATKQQIISEELGSAISTYGNLTPNEVKAESSSAKAKQFLPKINQDSQNITQLWLRLISKFESVEPPPACTQLAKDYDTHLNLIEGMFTEVHSSLQQAQSDPNGAIKALTSMMGSSSQADTSAAQADADLSAVCSQYHLTKEFSITTGSGAANLIR